jgi:hypothetical protein
MLSKELERDELRLNRNRASSFPLEHDPARKLVTTFQIMFQPGRQSLFAYCV